ncbi:MAG TPA: carboxypeptidase regulatory-like domain-containing protein [Candidatus Dormibacteraeota bacterium]|nr:carboxypeptidase regulatory-like domain-containing protein [Candidatus Dormibacteraeota bacterium]
MVGSDHRGPDHLPHEPPARNRACSRKRFLSRIEKAVFLAGVLMLCAMPALGQMNSGEISGTVKDPSGAIVVNARLEAIQTATQLKYRAVTNSSGEFLLSQLPVGVYRITVNAEGFKQSVQAGVAVHAGGHLRESYSLALGDQSETVTVSAAANLLQLESAAIQSVIQQGQVVNLPLKGRQFIDLVGLTPGITHAPSGTRGGALQQTGQTFGILGQRGGHNLYLVDGVSVTDEYYNNLVLSPSVDDIQEFSVDQTSYNAEYGGKSGGVINVITKSGSNAFHGSLFEFLRNNIFDAKNFFNSTARPIPPFKQNQFGGSIGGPIQKNKTFFFLNYEGQRTRKSQTQLFTVPTDAERMGIFQGTGITVMNPDTQTAFANDTIPAVDPVAAAIMAKFPHANLPGLTNNLLATDLSTASINQYNARIDHTFSNADSVFVRGSVFDANQFDPFGSGALNETLLPGFGYNLRTHTDNLAATWVHVFSPSWLNELRFGWMWVGGGQSSPNAGTDFAGNTGLQGVTTNVLDTGYPQASVTGYTTMGEPTQYVSRKDSDYELYDNAIWHHGTHTLKFGVYFFHLNFEPVNANNARGLFQFTGNYTGNALGDFLLGTPTQGQVGVGGRGALLGRTNWIHLYIQDGWQILPSLKLDIGLRYEYNQNVTDVNNNMAVVNTVVPGGQFVIASDNRGQISPDATALLSNIPIPYVTSAQAGWDRSLLAARPLRLAPRIGLAWSLPDHKTVIRSGFGIYTNQAAYSIIQNAALNLPFYFAKTVANANAACATSPCTTENILAASATGTVSANNIKHDFKVEYNNVWNFSMQRTISPSTSVQAQYIGSYTVHADNLTVQNLYPAGLLSSDPLHVRPIPQMSGFTSVTWDGWEKYNALTLTLTQRAWRGLTIDTNYTWSKALDDASNPGANNAGTNLPQDPNNMAAEKGLSDFDHRHRFVSSFLYQLPLLKHSEGWIHAVLADWQVGGIYTLESGSPFTVNLSTDNANNGQPVQSQRPDYVCDPNNGPKTTAEWFTTSCFAMPAALAYGTAGRDTVTGPGLNNFDATFQKDFSLREGIQLQFRADMFNFFNHPNFKQPNRIFTETPSNFGTISGANDPRIMQFSLRLAF